MSDRGLGKGWDIYLEPVRVHAHQLLVWAYSDVRERLRPDADEPSLTGILGAAILARLDHPDTPEEYLHYYIGDQVPVSPDGQTGNSRLRLDLVVVRTNVKPRLLFVFEAKRLKTSGFPIGEYVGPSGMGDFIECRYAVGNPEAAMIGLVHNKDISYWHGELRRSFDEDLKLKQRRLGIRSRLVPVSILPGLADELESTHVRTDQSVIRLFHIFLDCT